MQKKTFVALLFMVVLFIFLGCAVTKKAKTNNIERNFWSKQECGTIIVDYDITGEGELDFLEKDIRKDIDKIVDERMVGLATAITKNGHYYAYGISIKKKDFAIVKIFILKEGSFVKVTTEKRCS